MKKLYLLGLVAIVAGTLPAISRAALVSDYACDANADNLVDPTTNGVLKKGATIVTGADNAKIGAGALSLTGDKQYVDITAQGHPDAVAGMKTGSATFWMKSSVKSGGFYPVIGSNQPGFQVFEIVLLGDKMSMLNRATPPGSYGVQSNPGAFNDGTWHQVTWTWNVTATGENGVGGTSAVYLDGALNATPNPQGVGWGSSSAVAPWNTAMRIGSAEGSYYFAGSLDDVAIWDIPLTATQARTVYELGNDATLNYNAKNIAVLFTIFAGGRGSTGNTSDGKTWAYATGLTGSAGDVVKNHAAVILDGQGDGVALVPAK
jgi:hypothetical protein